PRARGDTEQDREQQRTHDDLQSPDIVPPRAPHRTPRSHIPPSIATPSRCAVPHSHRSSVVDPRWRRRAPRESTGVPASLRSNPIGAVRVHLPLSFLLLALLPSAAWARDIHTVGEGGSFATIASAVAAAAPDDRIEIAPGDYTECISLPNDTPLELVALEEGVTWTCADPDHATLT